MTSFFIFGKTSTANSVADKMLLGGKGAGLVRMSAMGIPVPPGFTIPTTVCNDFKAELTPAAASEFIAGLMPDVSEEMAALHDAMGYAPLVSVRSGAPVSMPGMMDTILNVGLTSKTLPFWKKKLGAHAALDSYRRLIQMLGSTAFGVPHKPFDDLLEAAKAGDKVTTDKELTVKTLSALVDSYKKAFQAVAQQEFPDTVEAQLAASIGAVFNSWNNERAITYRTLNKIDAAMGTAVTVQVMVFGNMNDDSGSGVLFSRCPSTGLNQMFGEFLTCAQGEDVVAGIRTPMALAEMQPLWPAVLDELCEVAAKLEEEYKDMVDIEFTVQDKVLYLLQCRPGKRGALAAFHIARDLVKEYVIDKPTAISRLTGNEYKVTKRPMVDPAFKEAPNAQGLFGSAGVACGVPVFTAQAAIDCTEPCILVTEETDPDDVGGMNAAKGVLTATGGQTSHAAVVARGMNKPCVVGAVGVVEAIKLSAPSKITIDGDTGRVWFHGLVPVVDNSGDEAVAEIVSWIVKDEPTGKVAFTVVGASTTEPTTISIDGWKYGDTAWYHELTALKNHGNKKMLTLDFRSANVSGADSPLLALYPKNEEDAASEQLANWLVAHAPNMVGLTVVGVPKARKVGKSGKIKVKFPMVDTLDDLLDGGEIIISPMLEMMQGETVMTKIKKMMAMAGTELVVGSATVDVGTSMPAEYQVFKALG